MLYRLFRSLRPGTSWQRSLYILSAAQFITASGFSSINPFLPLYIEELGTNTNLEVEILAGLVFSAQAFTMMLASPIWGLIADHHGRKIMVQRTMFGGAIVVVMMAFVRSAEELVVLRAVQGMVTGTLSASYALVAATAPRQRTGYAMGILQVSLFAGVAFGPLFGGIITDIVGHRYVFILTAVLLSGAGLLVRRSVTESFVKPTRERRRRSFLDDWRAILAAPGVRLVYSFRFLNNLGRMTILPIMPLFITTLLPQTATINTFTGLVIGLASATSTGAAVYLGRLGDLIGHRKVLTLSALACGLLYLPQSLVNEAWQLLLLQALTGAAAGGLIPALSALLAGYTLPGEEGSVYGLDNSVGAAARTVAPLLGASAAIWFGLRSTFIVTGLMFMLIGLMAALWLPKGGMSEDK